MCNVQVLDGLDTAAFAAADHPPAIPPAVPPALPPAVPSADLLGDSLFMDSPPLPDGDFIWSELASLVDDTPLFIMEQQGDFDGVWIDPLPGILEAPAAVAPAAVAVAAVAEAVPEADNASGKRKRGGEASESAAARKKRLRREALDAANPRRRWSKAAIARADAAKAYVVQAQLDGRAWGVPKQEKVVAKPVLARRDQGRVALEAKQRLQLLWEVFAPVAKEYGEASEADSCALPAEVVKEIKVLQKRIAVLEKVRNAFVCFPFRFGYALLTRPLVLPAAVSGGAPAAPRRPAGAGRGGWAAAVAAGRRHIIHPTF